MAGSAVRSDPDVLKRRERIRRLVRLERVARRQVQHQLAGQYHSVFKGRGMSFEEVRPYQAGDDVRLIDWNVSARTGEAYVKRFVEERELTVLILVDTSASMRFGTGDANKRDVAMELSALFALAAINNNDRVGLVLFSGEVERYIPPKKGRAHVMRLLREVDVFRPRGQKTSLVAGLEFLNRVAKRRAVVFLISDFMDQGYERALHVTSKRHDLVPVVLTDPGEAQVPPAGLLLLEDLETGQLVPCYTSAALRRRFAEDALRAAAARDKLFRQLRLEFICPPVGGDYTRALLNYFRIRARRL